MYTYHFIKVIRRQIKVFNFHFQESTFIKSKSGQYYVTTIIILITKKKQMKINKKKIKKQTQHYNEDGLKNQTN